MLQPTASGAFGAPWGRKIGILQNISKNLQPIAPDAFCAPQGRKIGTPQNHNDNYAIRKNRYSSKPQKNLSAD